MASNKATACGVGTKMSDETLELKEKLDAIREHIKVMIRPTTNRYTVTKRCKEILKIIEGER